MNKSFMLFIVFLVSLISTTSVYAQEITNDIKLDETNFPNAFVREVLYDEVDQNGDYILQKSEIDKTTSLTFNTDEVVNSENYKPEVHSRIDCKGLEYFQNLEGLYIATYRKDGEKYGMVNFNSIYQLENLKRLYIKNDNQKNKRWYFDKFPNLKELYLETISGIDVLKFGDKIKILELKSITGKAKIDLSKLKALKQFTGESIGVPEIKFGKNRKIKKLKITAPFRKSRYDLKRIDISGLTNLKSLRLFEVNKLKKIKFGKINNLREIKISGGKFHETNYTNKSIKTFDVSNFKKLKYLSISDFSKLNEIKFERNKKLNTISLDNLKSLKQIDLTDCKISKSIYINKSVKIENLRATDKEKIVYLRMKKLRLKNDKVVRL